MTSWCVSLQMTLSPVLDGPAAEAHQAPFFGTVKAAGADRALDLSPVRA